MNFDQNLVIQARIFANGRNIHKVSNLIAAYQGAYQLILDMGKTPESLKLFEEAEKDLQRFVASKRIEKLMEVINLSA